MASHFFDTSALAKRYIRETGSDWVTLICDDPAASPVFICDITQIEIVSAITRRVKGGNLTVAEGKTAIGDFDTDCVGQYTLLWMTRNLLIAARNLAERHGLRTLDAIQLAGGLQCNSEQLSSHMQPMTFVSADNELNDAAKIEGMIVENPNNYP